MGKRANMLTFTVDLNFKIPFQVPFPRCRIFVGRENELREIRNRLCKAKKEYPSKTACLALVGTGGMGKTQLVLEYAYRYHDNYSAVFWVDGSTSIKVNKSFLRIAKNIVEEQAKHSSNLKAEVRISRMAAIVNQHETLPDNLRDIADIITTVKAWLSNERNNAWLMIFENFNAFESYRLGDFLPALNGTIIITTRSRGIERFATTLSVSALNPKAAEDLFLTLTGDDRTRQNTNAASKIVEDLGFMPQAIHRVGSLVKRIGISLSDLLENSNMYILEVLHRSPTITLIDEASLATNFEVSFIAIQNQSPLAAEILQICSFLDNSCITEKFFYSVPYEAYKFGKKCTCWYCNRREPCSENMKQDSPSRTLLSRMKKKVSDSTNPIQYSQREKLLKEKLVVGGNVACLASNSLVKRLAPGMIYIHPLDHISTRERMTEGEKLQMINKASTMLSHAINSRSRKFLSEMDYSAGWAIWEPSHHFQSRHLADLNSEGVPQESRELLWDEEQRDIVLKNITEFATHVEDIVFRPERTDKNREDIKKYMRIVLKNVSFLEMLNRIGTVNYMQGHYEAALKWFKRGLPLWEKAVGKHHFMTQVTNFNIGAVLAKQDQGIAATHYISRAMADWDAHNNILKPPGYSKHYQAIRFYETERSFLLVRFEPFKHDFTIGEDPNLVVQLGMGPFLNWKYIFLYRNVLSANKM